MTMHTPIYTAPPGTGTAMLGKTLPDLMYEACARYENPSAFNQPVGEAWEPLSLQAFRTAAEEVALGLLDLGLSRGARVALYMESDVYFCMADMGCLIGGLISVPIYLSQSQEVIQYVIEHAEARTLFVSDLLRLQDVMDVVQAVQGLETIIVAQKAPEAALPLLPEHITVYTLADVRARGRARHEQQSGLVESLLAQVAPDDLATIIYTSGTTGRPKGVMLSHENISYNALTSFSGMYGYRSGPDGEVAISFLPLTHVFARTLHYGYVWHGNSIYFTTPDNLSRDLPKVHPTVFATVPRVLEKVYARLQERASDMTGLRRFLMYWAMGLAHNFELGREPTPLDKVQLVLADLLIYSKWRAALGGRIRFIIAGGAALSGTLANFFAAAGINILQGYGLTETSPVIAYNRPNRNRAGTVGEPIPGLEVTIAADGEILTQGPHVMKGYYKNPEATAEAIDADGWFHTGDVGEFTAKGYLRITDRKKDLFKLSTGKYVMPQPLENRLTTHPLVEQAVVVGAGQKFCAVLIFPAFEAMRSYAQAQGLDAGQPIEQLAEHPTVRARYQELIDAANQGMDPWSTIKRFVLVPAQLTIENGLLTPTLKVKRPKVRERFADEIKAIYDEKPAGGARKPAVASK